MNDQPVILTVDDDQFTRRVVEVAIEHRFGADYRVVSVDRPAEAIEQLTELRDAGASVALIVARLWMKDEIGTDLLARTRSLYPATRRLLLTEWADFSALQAVARATTLGEIDHYLALPWTTDDEQFLAAIGHILATWTFAEARYWRPFTLIGELDQETEALLDTLLRWRVPIGFLDATSTPGQQRVADLGIGDRLPAVVAPDGRVLPPRLWDLASAYGANQEILSQDYDVVILGSGPAGLSAAVYAASEGIKVLLVEPGGLGGQASASPMIRNYLGFPDGVSGSELLSRAWEQAWRFGVHMSIGRSGAALRPDGSRHTVVLDDGSEVRAKAVVLATGLAYRRIAVPSVERLLGRGVFYGTGATEAQALIGERVAIVGGANSAAQAAAHLARYAHHVTMIVRDDTLRGHVSEYLIDQLAALDNIEILLHSEVVGAHDKEHLRALEVRGSNGSAKPHTISVAALFILIGGTPHTDWLPADIARDGSGFVLTGTDAPPNGRRDGARSLLETTVPGIYAVGDVRHGSEKRMAAAVGEAAVAIRELVTTRPSREEPIRMTSEITEARP